MTTRRNDTLRALFISARPKIGGAQEERARVGGRSPFTEGAIKRGARVGPLMARLGTRAPRRRCTHQRFRSPARAARKSERRAESCTRRRRRAR